MAVPVLKLLSLYGSKIMVNVCCVEGCIQTKDVIYFNVPNSRTLRKKWLETFTPSCKVTNHSVVCSKHFLEEQYETVRGKKRLKAKVIPSIFDETSIPKTINESEKETKNDETPAKEIEKDKEKESPKNRIEEVVQEIVENRQNGDSIVKRTEPIISTSDPEANKDIEEIITNYQIKQIRPINRDLETDKSINLEINGEIEDIITNFHIKQSRPTNGDLEIVQDRENGSNGENDFDNIIDVDNLKDPVFIEVSVDKGGEQSNSQDCLMLLESVQCEVDPTSLMLEDPDPDPDPDLDDDVVDLGEKKDDPISLLTSSDEDDVIIQEPKIDTVEVSDETDEDDVPLVKLVEKPTKTKKLKAKHRAEDNIAKIMWGLYEFYCVECHFRTTSKSEYKRHLAEHPTVVQICQICGYTTASKTQFVRHKRKHLDDKKFRCHLCDFKARHNMSLIYHLKTHDCVKLVNAKKGFKCEKCGFQSDVKVDLVKHVKLCSSGPSKYVCGICEYETKRKSDMKRHKMRRHKDYEEDD
ncbi:unnamed protein product, partial [Brenthis ino]